MFIKGGRIGVAPSLVLGRFLDFYRGSSKEEGKSKIPWMEVVILDMEKLVVMTTMVVNRIHVLDLEMNERMLIKFVFTIRMSTYT